MLEVRFLGNFEVKYNQKQINISSRPAQALFAYLILSAGTGHRREKLAGLLWPDSLEETARENLRHALWRMRKALIAASSTRFLQADDVTISFRESSDYWLDAAELEKLSNDCSADELMNVLSNYQGELLAGFYDEWVITEREHLSSIFEHHMARLLSLLQQEGRWLDVLDWGERWIKLGQKPEPAYRALMSAHAAKGDMSKVVATHERCIRALKEFGVEPSTETRALYEGLKSGKENLESIPARALKDKREQSPKTNLPIPFTSFIGREREIEEVKLLLSSTRLLTLTGVGGIGKTRLAIQAAHELLRSFRDGVWWVELAPLTDEALVPQAVAQVLGVREAPDASLIASLKNYLREKQALLILDNCEHLMVMCAQLVNDLLSQCANLRIMVTSREVLSIMGEATFQVPALTSPVPANLPSMQAWNEFESIQLFIERAEVTHPGLRLTQQNASALAQICQRLDGIPLAIELAAARVKLLSLEEIAQRLDDRFAFLTQGSRAVLPRHQTLRAAINWSYDLLSQAEQTIFNRLSVFAGGFTLHTAEEVAAGDEVSKPQVLDLFGQLLRKSLVLMLAYPKGSNSETRYGMLETIHEYARERLDESGEEDYIRTRHLKYFLQLSEQAEEALKGSIQIEWLTRLTDERDNLHAALSWAAKTKDIEAGLYIAGSLRSFWRMRDLREGERWLAEFINQPESYSYPAARAKALYAHASILWQFQRFTEAYHAAEECLTLSRACGDRLSEIDSLYLVGSVMQHLHNQERKAEIELEALALAKSLGDRWRQAELLADLGWDHRDYLRAQAYWEEAVTLYRQVGDLNSLVDLLGALGNLELSHGDLESAQERLNEAVQLNRQTNNQVVSGNFLAALSKIASIKGDFEKARSFLEEEIRVTKESGDRMDYLWARTHLGHLALHQGNLNEARDILIETSRNFFNDKVDIGVVFSLEGMASVYVAVNQLKQAARLIGWSDAARKKIGGHRPPIEQADVDRDIATCLDKLGEVAFAKVYEEGQLMTFDQAVEFARKESNV